MAKVKIHAGDFPSGEGDFFLGQLKLPWQAGDGFAGKTISMSALESVEMASEEAVKRMGGAVGWGVVGAALLGPVGMLAGLLAGGRGKEVTFVAKFQDGKKMLASTDAQTFTKIQAIAF